MELIPKPVKKELINVLKKSQRYINSWDLTRLKKLSDSTIGNAGIFQDPDSLSMAVIIYAASKLLERRGFESEYAEETRNLLGTLQFLLEEDKISEYREEMKKLFKFIASSETQFKIYIDKVLESASIKKGGRIYEKGISAARSAELLGIGQWELLSYIGKTRIHDLEAVTQTEQRLRFARTLFKK